MSSTRISKAGKPELSLEFDHNYSTMVEGSSKRKRRSSDTGDIENSGIPEAKRIKEDEKLCSESDSIVSDERRGTDGRVPLCELAVGQSVETIEESSSSDRWSDICADEQLGQDIGDISDLESESSTYSPAESLPDSEDSSPKQCSSGDPDERNFFTSRTEYTSVLTLKNFMNRKGRVSQNERTANMFIANPALQAKMRSVLLEWIVEVCDAYKLHRETYHLSVDYLDRYLCQSKNISKGQLQLIGVTSLVIASKYEEIYPPKVSDFAYITDGACTEQDIIKMESLMVQVLRWRCTVTTTNAWILGFLQLICFNRRATEKDVQVHLPLYNIKVYETVSHLLDLCSLDCVFVHFMYKIIAVSSLVTVIPSCGNTVMRLAGMTVQDISDCLEWMQPFWSVLCEKFDYECIESKDVLSKEPVTANTDVTHMQMKHNLDLEMLEAVLTLIELKDKNEEVRTLLLTPPLSTEKRKNPSKTSTTHPLSEDATEKNSTTLTT